jgi:cystathionine beta-lyase
LPGERRPRRRATRLIHPDRFASTDFESLAVPTYRGSTVVFDSVASIKDSNDPAQYRYGLYGTPTTRDLALRIADIEGAEHCLIVPSGQAAIALPYFAFCRAGDHVLLTRSAYGPNTELAAGPLMSLGIEVERYDPMIGGGIASLIRDNTRLIRTCRQFVPLLMSGASWWRSTIPMAPACCSMPSRRGPTSAHRRSPNMPEVTVTCSSARSQPAT